LRTLFTNAIYGAFNFPKSKTCSKKKWEDEIVPVFVKENFEKSDFQSRPSLYKKIKGFVGLKHNLEGICWGASCTKEATEEEMTV
jgi:hypothetical protein